MKNVAIIGYGLAGKRFHGYLIGLVPGLRLIGYASRSEETRALIREETGLRAYSSLKEVVEDGAVDLVVLATPHSLHAEQAALALSAGKHVVTDKVMALTVEEADRMIEASRKSGRILSVFQNRRWDGDFLTLRKAIEEGLLGEVLVLESAVGRFREPRGWRREAWAGGGLFYDWGAHLIDQAVQLFGADVESVFCDFRRGVWGVEVETHAHAVLRFRRGPTVVIEISHISGVEKPRWLAMGTAGTLVLYGLDPQEEAMLAGDIGRARYPPGEPARLVRAEGGRLAETSIPTVPGRWTAFYENIARALEGEEELAVTPESVRAGLRILEAARRSAERKETVRP